jgi:hypothetical protein
MDNPFDPAFLEGPLPEIQQQAHLETAEVKLGIQLGKVALPKTAPSPHPRA